MATELADLTQSAADFDWTNFATDVVRAPLSWPRPCTPAPPRLLCSYDGSFALHRLRQHTSWVLRVRFKHCVGHDLRCQHEFMPKELQRVPRVQSVCTRKQQPVWWHQAVGLCCIPSAAS